MANMSEIVKTSFNSTLVQLKDMAIFSVRNVIESFNSTLVQLKDRIMHKPITIHNSFNSTLVQLKATISPFTPDLF